MMQSKMISNEYRTTLICVDSFEEQEFRGRLYNPYLPAGERFESLMQLLLRVEGLLDEMRFPQSFEAKRGFAEVQKPPQPLCDSDEQRGEAATFALRVLFRQNASWQGSVTWLDTGQEESFRSVLELLLMLDGALNSRGAKRN